MPNKPEVREVCPCTPSRSFDTSHRLVPLQPPKQNCSAHKIKHTKTPKGDPTLTQNILPCTIQVWPLCCRRVPAIIATGWFPLVAIKQVSYFLVANAPCPEGGSQAQHVLGLDVQLWHLQQMLYSLHMPGNCGIKEGCGRLLVLRVHIDVRMTGQLVNGVNVARITGNMQWCVPLLRLGIAVCRQRKCTKNLGTSSHTCQGNVEEDAACTTDVAGCRPLTLANSRQPHRSHCCY